jgi:hypothetical protein
MHALHVNVITVAASSQQRRQPAEEKKMKNQGERTSKKDGVLGAALRVH